MLSKEENEILTRLGRNPMAICSGGSGCWCCRPRSCLVRTALLYA